MKTVRDEVRELLDSLPEDVSLEDIQYHLYVRGKILKGLEAESEGRTFTQEEAVQRASRWLSSPKSSKS